MLNKASRLLLITSEYSFICLLYKTATTSAMQFSVELRRLGEWCKMFQSWQLHFTAKYGLFYLQCCSKPCFKTVSSRDFLFFTVLVTNLGPSPQSSTQCQQTFSWCTVCLVWLALGARTFTKPPLFHRNRLTCSGNPSFESCVKVKAQQR